MKMLTFLLASLVVVPAFALPRPLQIKPGMSSPEISGGALAGGRAGTEFSLLTVRSELTASGERLTLAYGDSRGLPLLAEPGFFHIVLDRDSKRVVVDLAQVTRTAVDPAKLSRILSASKYVAHSEMVMDPHDGSTNITLTTRMPVQIKVTPQTGEGREPGRLYIDIKPAGRAAR